MRQFRAYLADIWRDSGAQLPAAVVLVIAGALLEGIGLLAVLPLSALITGNADTEIGVRAVAAMDNLGLTSELARAFGLTGGFIVLLALRNLVVWRRDTHLFQLGAAYVDRWRVRLLRAIGNADWPTVSRLRRSEFEHAITNDVSRLSSGTDQMLRAGASVAISLVQLLIIAVLSPMLLLLVVVMLGVSLAFTLPLMRRANRLGKRLTKAGRHIYGVLGDFMSSQKLARLSNAEGDFIERFAGSIQDVRMNQTEFISSQIAARGWFQMAAGIIVIAALLIGFFLLKTPLSVLAVTILVLARLVGPVQMIAQTGQSLANALPAFEALKTTLDDLAKAASHAGDAPPVQPKIRGPATLQLQSVGFSYPGSAASVLEDVSLTIEAGEFAALVGPSGAGKTTLLDIASGLIEPDAGVVVADGRILDTEAERRHWREQMAYLPQDPFLFDASLRENLLWSAPDASEADIRNALEIADIEQMVDQAREGIGTRAGERGQALSGGERQRICLARALLRKPRLLILDEATNALDADLEEAILGRLSKMRDHYSILLITHRAETLRHADRVLRLENGGISAT